MLKEKKEWVNRRLKHVKPPEEIKRKLTRFLDGQNSKKLLKQWIEINPIVALNDDGTKAKYEPSIKKHWLEVCKKVTMPGYWMEMGVRGGRSVGWMLEEFPNQEMHGFDSWEGLPEEWFIGGNTKYRKGDMNVDMPNFPDNIKLYKGWFKDSLPKWRQDHKGPIALLHIDLHSLEFLFFTQSVNDLLSSTLAALNVFPLSHTKSTPHGYFKQPFVSFSSFAEKEHPVGAVGQAGNEHCGVI